MTFLPIGMKAFTVPSKAASLTWQSGCGCSQARAIEIAALAHGKNIARCGSKPSSCGKEKVLPEDLTCQTMLLTEAGCSYRKKLDETLALMNICPGNVIEFSSVEAIKECASLGNGPGASAGNRGRGGNSREKRPCTSSLGRTRTRHRNPRRLAQRQMDFAGPRGVHLRPREMMEGQPAQPIAIRRRAAS